VTVTLSAAPHSGEDVWGGRKVSVEGSTVRVAVGDRDAAVVRLK
jgi:hypothetical protein